MAHNRRYPWGKWLMRGRLSLRRGRDYDCGTKMMLQQLRNAACVLGRSVRVVKERPDGIEVSLSPRREAAETGGMTQCHV